MRRLTIAEKLFDEAQGLGYSEVEAAVASCDLDYLLDEVERRLDRSKDAFSQNAALLIKSVHEMINEHNRLVGKVQHG